jgi:hypothetical protein
MESLASTAMRGEQPERAARLFGAAEALRDKIGIPMTAQERVEYDRTIAELRAGMEPPLFESAWAEGRGMSMDQAVRFAVASPAAGAG